jgi:hypothetical protein
MCIHTFVSQKLLFCIINNSITQVVKFHKITQEQFGPIYTNLNSSYSKDRMTAAGIRFEGCEYLALPAHRLVHYITCFFARLHFNVHHVMNTYIHIYIHIYILWVLSSHTNFPRRCLWVHIVISSVCMAYKFCLKHKSVTHT